MMIQTVVIEDEEKRVIPAGKSHGCLVKCARVIGAGDIGHWIRYVVYVELSLYWCLVRRVSVGCREGKGCRTRSRSWADRRIGKDHWRNRRFRAAVIGNQV